MTSYTEVLYSTTAQSIRRHLIYQSKRMFYQAITLRWDRWHERKTSNTFQTSMYTVAFTSNFQRILMSANFSTTKRTELRKSEIFADTLYKHMFTSCFIGNVYNITF